MTDFASMWTPPFLAILGHDRFATDDRKDCSWLLRRRMYIPLRLFSDPETQQHRTLGSLRPRVRVINTIVHADYTERLSLLVVKRPGCFEFRNPGAMRIPIEQAMRGGESDCRNRTLQKMFRFIGLGEQAGSGLVRINAAWREQQWQAPQLKDETAVNEQTRFVLTTASLLPPDALATLERRLGDSFRRASEIQKLALVTALTEERVTHARLLEMTGAHPRDVTLALGGLARKHVFETGGSRKATYYFLPTAPLTPQVAPSVARQSQPPLSPAAPVTHQVDPSVARQSQPPMWPTAPVTPQVTPTVTPTVPPTVTPTVALLLAALETGPKLRKEIQEALGLRDKNFVLVAYLSPALEMGLIERTIPERPKSRLQKYRLTPAGRAVLAARTQEPAHE